jgi:carboxymethylenebutenolidase
MEWINRADAVGVGRGDGVARNREIPQPSANRNGRDARERGEQMGSTITYRRPDGGSANGYLAEGKDGVRAPGIVVIQEWWGLNDQIRGVADKLVAAGYRALVPDLYGGKVTLEEKEAEHLMHGLDFGAAAGQDIRGAVQHLKSTGSQKVGVTGFCMGGALTLLAAVNVPEADAFVTWYGYPPLQYVDASRIRGPVMGHWATEDTAFPIDKLPELEKKLRDANVSFEFHRYQARHAFANETADERHLSWLQYNAAAAELAWKRTLDFFAKQLR